MEFLFAAITLGFLGSFHCIGMCGPIALALPVHGAGPLKKTLLILSYNFGRVLTYSVFGLLAGLIGKSFAAGGYQQILSVTIGTLLLLSVLMPSVFRGTRKMNSSIYLFFSKIKNALSHLLIKKGHGSLFLIGLLNGLLPCGLVYIGIAGAMSTGDILKGVLFMGFFGFGTVPVMLLLPYAGSFITLRIRNNIRKAVRPLIAVTALLLILRGLNLGIPYVSPKINDGANVASCHESTTTKNEIKCFGPNSLHKK